MTATRPRKTQPKADHPGDQANHWVLDQWRALCRESPTCMAVFDRDTCYIAASRSWTEQLEGGRNDLAGKHHYDVHPDAPHCWRDAHAQALAGNVLRNANEHVVLADGREFWTEWVCQPWRYPDQSIGGFIVSIENHTAKHLAKKQLRQTQHKLVNALEAAQAGTWEANLATGENIWSDEIWSLYGLKPYSVAPTTESWRQTVDPTHRAEVVSRVVAAVEKLSDFEAEWRVNLPNEDRWLFSRAKPVVEEDGRIERYIGIVIDITARKMAEFAAATREHELHTILDAIPVGVGFLDRKARFRYVNTGYERIYDITRDQIIGQPLRKMIPKVAWIPEIAAGQCLLHFASAGIMTDKIICVVDDDPSVRESLKLMLTLAGYRVETFASGKSFLSHRHKAFGCIVLDWRLDDMTGQEVLDALGERGSRWPVLVLTAYGDIPTTVKAMRAGACDFMTKSEPPNVLLDRIATLLADHADRKKQQDESALLHEAVALLSPREREVLGLAARGLNNEDIATSLKVGLRTVEAHRSHIARKLKVDSLADFFRLAALSGWDFGL